jgi:hypothetical protein
MRVCPWCRVPAEDSFANLVARVGAFHITDRSMKQAQADAQASLSSGAVDDRVKERYLKAVRAYFCAFEKEARAHLRDVDRRLESAHQVAFNLTAERGVAVKRIEATQSILAEAGNAGP